MYNGLNRRIQKTTGGSTYDSYFNNGWKALEIRKDGSANPWKQYVWSIRYIDAVICRFYDANTDGLDIETLYYCNDANMNVTTLVNTSGAVQERYEYDPYGKVTIYNSDWSATVTWANSKKNEVLYCGYLFDTETGLYHVRRRMYHPTLGRWLQRDPLRYVDGMSLYEYVMSLPTEEADPFAQQVQQRDSYVLIPPLPGKPVYSVKKKWYLSGGGNCFHSSLCFQAQPIKKTKIEEQGEKVVWELTFLTSPGFGTKRCYCCKKGGFAEIRFKQWVDRKIEYWYTGGRKGKTRKRTGWDHGVGNPEWRRTPKKKLTTDVLQEIVVTDEPGFRPGYVAEQKRPRRRWWVPATKAQAVWNFRVSAWKVCKGEPSVKLDEVLLRFKFIYVRSWKRPYRFWFDPSSGKQRWVDVGAPAKGKKI